MSGLFGDSPNGLIYNLKNIIQVNILERIRNNSGGPIGQYIDYAHGYFAFPKLEGDIGPRMKFRGKEVLNWSLNNYLGLANHPEVRKADAIGAVEFGHGRSHGRTHDERADQIP